AAASCMPYSRSTSVAGPSSASTGGCIAAGAAAACLAAMSLSFTSAADCSVDDDPSLVRRRRTKGPAPNSSSWARTRTTGQSTRAFWRHGSVDHLMSQTS
ncbi:hypothetical protein Vretimale_4784, partial [Volvox reticuliferus]